MGDCGCITPSWNTEEADPFEGDEFRWVENGSRVFAQPVITDPIMHPAPE